MEQKPDEKRVVCGYRTQVEQLTVDFRRTTPLLR